MSNVLNRGVVCGILLLLVAGRAAGAQDPHVTGRMRELVCRGKPGIDMRVDKDPSPRDPRVVAMVLRYERLKETRSIGSEGMGTIDYGRSIQFIPGSCTWGYGRYQDIPPEPLVVYFDLPRDAQTHVSASERDTTIDVAINFPDVASLPRFLSDSNRFWVFFVDDVSNFSISYARYPLGGGIPPIVTGSAGEALPTDTAARRAATVRTPAGTGGVAGTLRDAPAGATTTSVRAPATTGNVAVTLPADSAARRAATARTPTTTSVAGPLRDGRFGRDTLSGSRALPTSTKADDARTSSPQLRANRVYDVRTEPGPLGVRLTFNATDAGGTADILGHRFYSPTGGIKVQFSRTRPSWDERERLWSYPPGWNSPWFATIRLAAGGGFEAEPFAELEDGQRYYYLITVWGTSATSVPAQRTGTFTAEIRHPLNGLFSP